LINKNILLKKVSLFFAVKADKVRNRTVISPFRFVIEKTGRDLV